MAAFQIRSAACILLFILLTQGSFSTLTRRNVYEKTIIPASELNGIQILKTIHNLTKIHCRVVCSEYEDRCNAMQLLDVNARKGTCKVFYVLIHCITFNSTLSVDELATIYTSTDHSAKYLSTNQLETSCAAIHNNDPYLESGLYSIYPGGILPGRVVYCDMCTDGGGWMVFQRRQNGSLQFNRGWAAYRQGFGSADGELWIGNTALHQLTASQPYELRVEISDWDGQHRYAAYSSFIVANEANKFRLTVSGYSGTAGDSLKGQNKSPFTTIDRDNDNYSPHNCATIHGGGGWWLSAQCGGSNLNGRYVSGGVSSYQGVIWTPWRGTWYSYKAATMMMRPRQ